MNRFLLNIKAELWKCRRTAAYWITLAAAMILPLILLIVYITRPLAHIQAQGNQPWLWHIDNVWETTAIVFLPMYVILVTSLVVQIEYRSNTWKQVYASPRSYADIFFSKFVVLQLLIISCILLFNILLLIVPYIASVIHKGYKFTSTPIPWSWLFTISGKLYLSVLALSTLQYWLSLRIRNYIVPLALGLVLLVAGLIAHNWEYIAYHPYAYPLLTYLKLKKAPGIFQYEIYSAIWLAVVLGLGLLDTVKRKEHG